MLSLPKDCRSIKDYFLTRVGHATGTDLEGEGGGGGREEAGLFEPLNSVHARIQTQDPNFT